MIRTPDFSKNPDGLLPVIVQDAVTKNVLMQAYMNQEAHQKTIDQKRVWFYSRSKNRLWAVSQIRNRYPLSYILKPHREKLTIGRRTFLVK